MGSRITNIRRRIQYRGSDCTGSDGAVNRTLVVTGPVALEGTLVIIGKSVQHPTYDYTVSGSTITFLINIDNSDYIDVVTGG